VEKKVEELSINAKKGDPDAVKILFDIAKNCELNRRYENAALAYREAAFVCRTLASRNSEEKTEVEYKLEDMTVARDIFAWWVEEHPDGMMKLPRPPYGIDEEFIRVTVVRELLLEEKFNPIFWYLEGVLSGMGMKFFSPGGSIQRRVCALLVSAFGLQKDPYYTKFLQETSVRVGLDLIADEI